MNKKGASVSPGERYLVGDRGPERLLTIAAGSVQVAMDDLIYVIHQPRNVENEIARIEGYLSSDHLAAALASEDKEVRRIARRQRRVLLDEWKRLKGEVK